MRARRLALRAVAAALVASGGALWATGVATAETAASVESGWWSEAAAGPVSAPAPPSSSSRQLQVSSGLKGPLAFAAVRIGLPGDLDPATASVTLTLVQSPNSAVGTVAVSACPTTSPWSPGDGQSAGSAPGYDCTQGKQAVAVDSDGQDTFNIPAGWSSGSSLAVAIVPAPGATTPFSVQYAEPTIQAVRVSGAPAAAPPPAASNPAPSGSGSTPSAAVGAGAAPPAAGSSIAPAPMGPPALQPAATAAVPSDFGVPPPAAPAPSLATSAGLPGGAPASAPPGGGAADQSAGTLGSTPRPASAAISLTGPGRDGRILAVSLLLLLGVVMFGLAGQPGRSPRLLLHTGGAAAAGASRPVQERQGGIGRFAKPRNGPPRRL